MTTISDVAKRAGVSIATVSYVLNGRTNLVREETAEKIRRAAEELNYQASPVARGLATGSSYTVAVVLPHHFVFSHPIGSQEFLGAAEEFYLSDYSMLIKPSYEDERKMKRPHSGLPAHVAGVLALGPMSLDNPDLAEARALGKPMVAVEDVPEEWGITCVNVDNYRAAQMVTSDLIGRGHTRIGVLAQTRVSACMFRRIQGYNDALAHNGLAADPALLVDLETQDDSEVARATEDLLDSKPAPSALIALNSAFMPGVTRAIDSRGLMVPERFGVGCVDYGMPPSFQVRWPVVTLRTDLRRQGELAARTLVEMLRAKSPVESRYIEPELIVIEPEDRKAG